MAHVERPFRGLTTYGERFRQEILERGLQILFGEQNPAAKWAEYFGEGSEPVDDAAGYPLFAEVRDLYVRLREKNLALLESLSEADLDKPTVAPPKGREREFATFGSSFLVLALHQMIHRGHVTDARRAARVAA